ncbi:MAG: ferritin-like domain-containing protein [Candidatus Eremiobacteraeota bacterium]|nr:ferritin-like domain-containing protein [Candidatus Eremiobacteraeota bacterium]MBC5827195.1 ferritin-like domain-containing protein [Candidatus Eremiobacteraeota bacterium]
MPSAVAALTPLELSILNGGSAGCESVRDIINIAATAEALAVTFLGVALESAENGKLALNAEHKQALRAARAEEQAHYLFLTGAGARPLTTTFTVPDPKLVTDVPTFLKTLIVLEEAFVAAYLAAAQEFGILGQPKLVQIALATAAVEAEHRVALRFFAIEAGVLAGLPNDIAFEKSKFASVGEAAAALRELGFIDGSGAHITYPGPGKIDYTGVKHLKP